MATTLQIVDPNSLSTVLFDLNDSTGANSGLYGSVLTYLVSDPDWGVPQQRTSVQPDVATPTARTTFAQTALADVTIKVRIKGTSYDNITKAIGALSQFLSVGCVMKWIPNGSSETRYIDIEPSDPTSLLHGQELAMYEATTLFDTPRGITLKLKRQPFMRGAALTPSTNKLSNATLLRDTNNDGTPDGWTILSTPTLSVLSSADALHVVAGAASRGLTQDTSGASASSGQTWTMSAEVKVTSGTASIALDWRTSGNANISTDTSTTTSAVWTRVSVTATAPATTDHIRATIQSSGAAATFDVRNVQVEQAASASYFRVTSQTVTVDPAGTSGFVNILPIYNPGSAPAPAVIKVSFPDASNNTAAVQLALRSSESIPGRFSLADWMNNTHYAQAEATGNNWTVTLGTDTSATAGTNASGAGSNVARVTHATAITTMTKRITWSRTANLDSLRGDLDVWARIKGAAARKYRVQLRWAFGSVSPLPNMTDEYVHDLTDASAFDWVMVKLGRISVPIETDVAVLATFKAELWTAQKAGAASNLDVDYIRFVPTESSITTTPEANSTTWFADQMTTPVTNPGSGTATNITPNTNLAQFQNLTDNIGTPAIADLGHHRTKFVLGAQDYNGADRTLKVNIRNTTDSTDTTSATVTVKAGTNRKRKTLEWDAASGKSYQAQVDDPSAVGSKYLTMRLITDTFIPVFEQNSSLQSDPGSRPSRHTVEKLDSSGNALFTLDSEGVPFWVPPGLSMLYVEAWDPVGKNYNENFHVVTRTTTVQATIYPRWWV